MWQIYKKCMQSETQNIPFLLLKLRPYQDVFTLSTTWGCLVKGSFIAPLFPFDQSKLIWWADELIWWVYASQIALQISEKTLPSILPLFSPKFHPKKILFNFPKTLVTTLGSFNLVIMKNSIDIWRQSRKYSWVLSISSWAICSSAESYWTRKTSHQRFRTQLKCQLCVT